MKSLNSFLELYKPKSPDEQKFVDKHIVKTRGDANGNGDDVFKASKVKKVERTKERKGYEPGDDEKVYEEAEKVDEKMNMKTADMGDVITDFRKSDAPQFKGKTKAQRTAMAIAAKLSAERPMKEEVSLEETLEELVSGLAESSQRVMFDVFTRLTEENQERFVETCKEEGGIDAMLDFSIKHRNVE